jgi:hypothetical protein
MFELDHLFVWTSVGGREADQLVAFGLTEGEPNTHPGQGTACRRFFFRNAFLELLWVTDPEEARSALVQPLQLWDRWSQQKAAASPYGVCLRPVDPGCTGIPFSCREYRPPYLPSPLAIHVGQSVPLYEPLWFYLNFGRRPDHPERPQLQPLNHSAGFREVSGLKLLGPGLALLSDAAQAASQALGIVLGDAPEPMAEVTFDGGMQGQHADFRPLLPLAFRW